MTTLPQHRLNNKCDFAAAPIIPTPTHWHWAAAHALPLTLPVPRPTQQCSLKYKVQQYAPFCKVQSTAVPSFKYSYAVRTKTWGHTSQLKNKLRRAVQAGMYIHSLVAQSPTRAWVGTCHACQPPQASERCLLPHPTNSNTVESGDQLVVYYYTVHVTEQPAYIAGAAHAWHGVPWLTDRHARPGVAPPPPPHGLPLLGQAQSIPRSPAVAAPLIIMFTVM